jgi:3-isopropylmalate/(R)-2-methylmalate dehydratase large subunit
MWHYIISQLTTSGGTGYFVEYAGDVFEDMSMEGRMTVCNLSIEMGGSCMIAPDQKNFDFLEDVCMRRKVKLGPKQLHIENIKTDMDAVLILK